MDQCYNQLTDYWECASDRRRKWLYVCIYTFVFLVAVLLAYIPFLLKGMSFISKADGREQHYPYLVYIGRIIHQVLLNFLHGDFTIESSIERPQKAKLILFRKGKAVYAEDTTVG